MPVYVLGALLVASAAAFVLGLMPSQRRVRARWFGSTGGFFGAAIVFMSLLGVAMFIASHLYPVWAASSIVVAAVLFGLSWRYVRNGSPPSSLPPPPRQGDDETPRATLEP